MSSLSKKKKGCTEQKMDLDIYGYIDTKVFWTCHLVWMWLLVPWFKRGVRAWVGFNDLEGLFQPHDSFML